MSNKIILGDCLNEIKKISPQSIQSIITSPPYWGLRNYGAKNQIGLEETPEGYIERLVTVFSEIKHCMKDNGTIWLNIGDTYYSKQTVLRNKRIATPNARKIDLIKHPYLKEKDLCGIPFRVVFEFQKKLNLYLRQCIIWHKPNAVPCSAKDRPMTDYEFLFLLSKSEKYYYDHEAVLEPYLKPLNRWGGNKKKVLGKDKIDPNNMAKSNSLVRERKMRPNPKGRTCRAVWSINTEPSPETHFAIFPQELPKRCIKASTKENDIVLDPFAGSGTTLIVAKKLNRRYIGIEISKENYEIILKKLNQTNLQLDL